LLLERIQFAQAVVSRSIEPETTADKQKMIDTLNLLKKEDPTFTWTVDRETGQTLMNGMGMLHLEIKQHRMERDFRLKVRVGQPRVSYRETIRERRRGEGECVKHTGAGGGLFAKVTVELEPHGGGHHHHHHHDGGGKHGPGEPGHAHDEGSPPEPVVVRSKLKPDALPEALLQAAEQGVRGALDSGELGYPLMNVQATIMDAQMDEQLSNEVAFQAAGADAVRKAMRDNVVLLEPWMKLEVTVPEAYGGSIIADVNAREGEVVKFEVVDESNVANIEAHIPLRNMFDYADAVRSLSQGRAASNLEPYEYRPAPAKVLHRLLHPEEYY
jgi:elongation factor G